MSQPETTGPDHAPPQSPLRALERSYSPEEDRPLGGYLAAMLTYSGVVAALGTVTALRGRLPERIDPWDVTLISVATHRLARTITKDAITSPLRAPFTRYGGPSAPAELHEEVVGHGVRHAVGELLTCPFCIAQWIATGLTAGHLLAPRATRAATVTLTAVAAADFLQYAYAKAQQSAG